MRNKKSLLLSLAILGVSAAMAAPLTPEAALARALNNGNAKAAALNSASRLSLSYTYNNKKATPALYVFSNTQSFLIISAYDAVTPILGYSDKSSFDAQNIPDGMKWWLETKAAQIEAASQAGKTPLIYAPADRQAISPQLKTLWSQRAPYNMLAPYIGDTQCPIGCVATAMAQVMKYYNWPDIGEGTKTISWNPSGAPSRSLSFDYSATPFKWDEMLDDYSIGSSPTEAQKQAVADLMYGAAISVSAKFGSSATSAGSYEIPKAFVNHFKYSQSSYFAEHKYYTAEQWSQMIYDNLVNYGPVLYTGSNDGGGHAFVLDGYNTDGYFHVNWGWGGLSDGYYLLSNLSPETQGTGGTTAGYNFGETIVLGLKKASADDKLTVVMVNQGGLKITRSPGARFNVSTATGTGGYFNFSAKDIDNLMFGLKLTNEQGEAIYVEGSKYSTVKSFTGVGSFTATPSETIPNGTYIVVPAYYYEGEWHDFLMPYGYVQSNTITAQDGVYSTVANTPGLLKVTDEKLTTGVYSNAAFSMTMNLTNINDYTYNGGVCLQIGTIQNGTFSSLTRSRYTPVEIKPGETLKLDYISTFTGSVSKGTYAGYILDYFGNRISEEPITIEVGGEADGVPFSSNLRVENNDNVNKNNIRVYGDMFLKSGNYFANSLYLYFFNAGSGKAVTRSSTPIIFLSEDEFYRYEFTGSIEDAEPGQQYLAALYLGSDLISNYPRFTIGDYTGVENILDEAAVIRTEYYNVAGSKVTEENLIKGIYIKVEYLNNNTTRTSRVAISK